jgi:hypothetical protein
MSMARNHSDAQPLKVLTAAQWDALHAEIQDDKNRSVSVAELCRRKGVSKARYYQRYPVGPKQNAPQDEPEGRSTTTVAAAVHVQQVNDTTARAA